jgi:DNA-binding CsgD family transcriptional regulator
MLDMRELPAAASGVGELSDRERAVLRLVAEGLGAREIAQRLDIAAAEVYRFVAWIIDELQPAPNGETMSHVHARHGSRPAAAPADLEEFERRFGPSLPADDEG